jgi:adenylosuccinate synthase
LNPAFVEWLMGLPKGWTTARIGSGPVATEWSRYKQQLQYALSQIAQGGS